MNTEAHRAKARPGRKIDPRQAGLILIDVQAMLLPAMWERERVLRQTVLLVRGLQVLGVPVVVTEQYRKGLGPTVAELADVIRGFSPIEKLTFSGLTREVGLALDQRTINDVLLCGIETHVCVTQTALDLLDAGKRVFVVADACSSRTMENWRIGRERMTSAGAVEVSVEMVLFELLGRAGTPDFREILKLVK
jgi:nicotinamidase-related amidase